MVVRNIQALTAFAVPITGLALRILLTLLVPPFVIRLIVADDFHVADAFTASLAPTTVGRPGVVPVVFPLGSRVRHSTRFTLVSVVVALATHAR